MNLGCGEHLMDGFENLDYADGFDIRDLSRWDKDTVDLVYMSNVLEYVGVREYGDVLLGVKRILKPNGTLILSLPDLEKCIDLEPQERAMMATFGDQTDKEDFQKCGFKFSWIERDLKRLGFEGVSRIEPITDDCSKHPGTMTLTATNRPDFEIPEEPRVVVCMSYPRVGFTLNSASVMKIATDLQWDTQFYTGAFWDKDLTRAMKRAIDTENYDYVLTVDFDSVFDSDDAGKLLAFMQSKPELGAAFSVQMSRWADRPLVHDKRKRYSESYTEVDGGHFGLTMIRCDMLRKIPQPWLWGIPGPDGEWDSKDRMDADMNFWMRCREHGFRIAQVNEVVIGHMEICIKWPCQEGVMYQPINDYHDNKKPKDAVLHEGIYRECEEKPKQASDRMTESEAPVGDPLLNSHPR